MQTTLKVRPDAKLLSSQNKTNSGSPFGVLFLIMFHQSIFKRTLQIPCVYIIPLSIMILWNSCMSECMCLCVYMNFLWFFFGSFFPIFPIPIYVFLFNLIVFTPQMPFCFLWRDRRVWLQMGRAMGEDLRAVGGIDNQNIP